MVDNDIHMPSPAVARAVKALESLVAEPKTLSNLSRELEIPKSSLHGIVTTLILQGWITTSDSGRLELGERLYEVGVQYGRSHRLVRTFRDIARRAVEETGETTFLGMLSGSNVEHLARVDGTQRLRFVVREGDLIPAHATALGKVILAHRESTEIEQILGSELLPAMTPRTVTRLTDLESQFASIREQGFALDLGEADADLHCVAAPVWDATDTAIASVAIAAPALRLSSQLTTFTDVVRGIALTISRQLGYEGDGFNNLASVNPARQRDKTRSRHL